MQACPLAFLADEALKVADRGLDQLGEGGCGHALILWSVPAWGCLSFGSAWSAHAFGVMQGLRHICETC